MLCGVTATLGSNPSATATAARPHWGRAVLLCRRGVRGLLVTPLVGRAALCARGRRPARSALFVAPLVFRAPGVLSCWAGLLCVPVGGGPPASRPRRELRSARRLEARPGPATAHGHRSQAPHGPPAPFTPVGPGVLTCGLARRLVVRAGPDAARGHRSLSPT